MEPNTSSPANVDAGVMYRRFKEGDSKDYRRKWLRMKKKLKIVIWVYLYAIQRYK